MKAVLFDLDGVLVNSEVVKHEVIKEFIEKGHYPIAHERFFLFIGAHKSMNVWDEIFAGIDPQLIDQAQFRTELRAYRHAHLDHLDYGPYRMEHIVEILDSLKARKIRLACASSSSMTYIRTLLTQCAILPYFDLIVTGDDFTRSKPDPEIYQYCAKAFQLEPQECVVIEDSPYGIAAGKAAGMRVIAKKEHYFGLDQSQADQQIEDYRELLALLDI